MVSLNRLKADIESEALFKQITTKGRADVHVQRFTKNVKELQALQNSFGANSSKEVDIKVVERLRTESQTALLVKSVEGFYLALG